MGVQATQEARLAAIRLLDGSAKRRLLVELVQQLSGRLRGEKAEALEARRSENRAMRTMVDHLQGANVSLQQQLVWATRNWQYTAAVDGDGSTFAPVVGSTATVSTADPSEGAGEVAFADGDQ
uniref:Uncharacterized protein n=1 Tax=Alexandrium catenella TaxID=2925 RepID=A0A7S1L4V3_ALECA